MTKGSAKSLARLYDRFVGILDKLPGGLQKPLLKELQPIRDLFLDRRVAHIGLVGGSIASVPELFAAMGVRPVRAGELLQGWRDYTSLEGNIISILDARASALESPLEIGLSHRIPDLFLIVQDAEPLPEDWKESMRRATVGGTLVLGLCSNPDYRQRLEDLLSYEPLVATSAPVVLEPGNPATAESLCAALPLQAQIEFAQFTKARRAQAYIASRLLRSFSAMCAIIALQPIPFADLPFLLSLQSLMIGLIIYTTGRNVGLKLIAEFLTSLGLGAAAGLAFREAARIAVRIVPFWGNAVSGVVAGAGTYAIGRAAIAYFIDDALLAETRRLFTGPWCNSTTRAMSP